MTFNRPVRNAAVIALSLMVLQACGQPSESYGDDAVSMEAVADLAPAPQADAASPAVPPTSANATPTATTPTSPTATVSIPRLAYVYRYGLELPGDAVTGVMQRHEKACTEAGPTVCQVIGQSSDRFGRDQRSAQLELRATPAWLTRFRNGLDGEAKAAGGRVSTSATESEDLTRALSDTEAALTARTTLRDRLQQLLATRSGNLEQLLQVERELARVQGEIDATRSSLETIRARVETSRLILSYSSQGQLAPDSAWRPVVSALQESLSLFMLTLGGLIRALALLAPIGLIVGPLVWWGLKRRRAKRSGPTPAAAPADRNPPSGPDSVPPA